MTPHPSFDFKINEPNDSIRISAYMMQLHASQHRYSIDVLSCTQDRTQISNFSYVYQFSRIHVPRSSNHVHQTLSKSLLTELNANEQTEVAIPTNKTRYALPTHCDRDPAQVMSSFCESVLKAICFENLAISLVYLPETYKADWK